MSSLRISALKTLKTRLELIRESNETLFVYSGVKKDNNFQGVLPVLGLSDEDRKQFEEKLRIIEDAVKSLLEHSEEIINKN